MNRLFNFDMELNKNIPVLIDFDGVIRLGNKPAKDAILVYTGKTKYPLSADTKIRPQHKAKNLKAVKNILNDVLSKT